MQKHKCFGARRWEFKMRQSILLRRIHKHPPLGKLIIGIGGVEQGAGATHTAFMIGTYFRRWQGQRVGFIEWEQDEIKYINNEIKDDENNSFSHHGIWFYKNVCDRSISSILSENYQCIVIDFGTRYEKAYKEFMRCDIKILLASGALWKEYLLDQLISPSWDKYGEDIIILLSPTLKSTVNRLKKEIPNPLYSLPFEPNPFSLSMESVTLLQKIFYN